jgi:hypothetical protein
MLKRKSHPDQFAFDLSKDAALERMIEARVAIRAETAAIRWRFRLILIESFMITSLVLVAGLTLKQPTALVVRGAIIVGMGCLLSGILLIGLSGVTGHLLSAFRRWRSQ